MNKQNKNNIHTMSVEPFANYQDVKTKTINWCKKMQAEGLLTPEQYDNCTSTFKDVTSGILPKEFKVPPTGMSRNYSLYNTRSTKLTPNISGDNTNTVMIVTNTGLYMACNSNNDLYYIKDINDSTINQNELYFTLVPQNNDVYSIMSPYNKYLIANTNWGAEFSGTTIGTMSSWNVSKVDDKVILQSIQYSGFYLSFNDKDKPLKIIYGKDASIQWLMIPKKETSVNDKYGEYTGVEYLVTKTNILTKIKNITIDKLALDNIKKSLITLQENIRNNYSELETYMQNYLDGQLRLYNLSNQDYQSKVNSINTSSTITPDLQQSLIDSIPTPAGSNISDNDINAVVFNISNMKNYYIQIIQEEISKIDLKLNDLDITTTISDYNNFILDIQNEITKVKSRIEQNNIIMGRQKDNYEKINEDVSYIEMKKDKNETIDTKLKLNLDIVDGYKTQTSLLVKIYPFVIVLLLLFLIYLIYLTAIKFKDNIYDKY
jgi:hypothetical protein